MDIPTVKEGHVLSPGEINPNVPPSLNLLVERMTQYEPAARIQNLADVIQILKQIVGEIQPTVFSNK